MKKLLFLYVIIHSAFRAEAQSGTYDIKPPFITVHFGTGNVRDINPGTAGNYFRRMTSCPTDGYYSYVAYTSACFNDDWHTLTEDHTPGDQNGNMMLVNAAPEPGIFLRTTFTGFKGNTTYEFGVWLMNLCRPSDKCPFPLLANITIRLETQDGKRIAQFATGELPRVHDPRWTQHRANFTTPASISGVILTMIDNAPGGCGNDFALDDITFRELVKRPPVITTAKKPVTKPAPSKPVVSKKTPEPAKREIQTSRTPKLQTDSLPASATIVKPKAPELHRLPLVLTTRTNTLIKQIETEAGEITIDLYDNGEIDNDTVSIYHNNTLIVSRARLSERAITFKIPVNANNPRHEVIMVAENLGSIPPNTSLMIITAGKERYEVRISSNEQKNAKVVFELRR